MATLHATVHVHAILFLAFTRHFALAITTMTIVSPTITKPKQLATKLIHRDSVLSPYYNPNETTADRAKRAIKSSIARLAYVSEVAAGMDDIRTNILPNESSELFYVNFSIGQPPIPQFAVMDSGSSLLWVKCLPCKPCSTQSDKIFDPSKSSTYASMSCTTYGCPYSYCNSDDECPYNISYLNGPQSFGIYGFEQLTFETDDGGKTAVSEILFGCARIIGTFDDAQFTGVFGLGIRDTISFITQLGSKFSYCIGNMMNPHYSYNHLLLGNGAIIEGDSTPIVSSYGRYYVTLEGISIEGEMLDIDPNIFEKTLRVNTGVIIDSGTSYSWLAKTAYDVLKNEVESILGSVLRQHKGMPWQLCYTGIISEDLHGFPVVAFHFAEGAELVLDTDSMFLHVSPTVFCMAIAPSYLTGNHSKDMSIVGMMAQQNYNVGYDIEGRRLYFQRIDCELLEN